MSCAGRVRPHTHHVVTTHSTDAQPDGPDRWAEPVIYLREYPEAGIGPRGFPYYACAVCAHPLQALPRTAAAGAMLVCIWGCGQRYWVDDAATAP